MKRSESCVAVVLLVLGVGCSGPDAEKNTDDAAGPLVDLWSVGADVGAHFGPFPKDSQTLEPDDSGWVAVVLPDGDPIEAFYGLVEDAADQGFETWTGSSGPCQQAWSREEVPFGTNGEGDGFDFNGETPFGDALPVGATVGAVACDVTAEGAREQVAISIRAPLEIGSATFPNRPAIVLATTTTATPDTEFRRQELDLEFPDYASVPLTERELSLATLDEQTPLAPLGVAVLPNDRGGCFGALLRSPNPPAQALDEASDQSFYEQLLDVPAKEIVVADQRAAVRQAGGGGADIFVAAVSTDSGSDVIICISDA